MSRENLITESFRLVRFADRTHLQVRSVHWDGHIPYERWHTVSRRRGELQISDFAQQVERRLGDLRFFATCKECQEFLARGWMHQVDLCQACATKNHGVICGASRRGRRHLHPHG